MTEFISFNIICRDRYIVRKFWAREISSFPARMVRPGAFFLAVNCSGRNSSETSLRVTLPIRMFENEWINMSEQLARKAQHWTSKKGNAANFWNSFGAMEEAWDKDEGLNKTWVEIRRGNVMLSRVKYIRSSSSLVGNLNRVFLFFRVGLTGFWNSEILKHKLVKKIARFFK